LQIAITLVTLGSGRTIRYSLEVVVRLGLLQFHTDKFVVNFVLDITQKDKRRDHAFASARLHRSRDLPVPHIVAARHHRSDGLRRHRQQNLVLISQRLPIYHPVRFGSISEVLRFVGNAIETCELVIIRLADGRWDTRVERIGGEWVAAAETVGTDTTFTVLCISTSSTWTSQDTILDSFLGLLTAATR